MAARAVVGLDIGTSGVRAAELVHSRGVTTLQRFGQVPLPIGAVRDGEVVVPDLVAAALRQLWAEAKFSTKRVVLGVANQKVVVRQIELPLLAPREMRSSLAFQVQDVIPMPVDQAILDYHPLEEFTADTGVRMLRLMLVAASRDMVDSALLAVQAAGLRPVSVDLTSFAVLRSLSAAPGPFAAVDAEALIDVGSSVTNIVIHQSGVPRFVRILLMGGGDITDAVAERLGVPLEQAESIKQITGMSAVAGEVDQHPASRAIESTAGTFVEEVRGSLAYYAAQPGAAGIGRVVLSGGGSQLRGLVERLAAATRLPVAPARPLALLTLGRTGLTDEQLTYVEPLVTVPIGLGFQPSPVGLAARASRLAS